ncbi:Solute carrier family 2, facilitated glucose transporter [Phytophthora megakarya]|uniref:Solute carrier family 2, facilitated glucose transporter n=1 Tax=Phytophthora megakarya TaxID=4795 RepID=A0A225V3Y5_9STRA|nr:Solute carrier family 2, facilitated glucose transporter [Phytophthora megakarya]
MTEDTDTCHINPKTALYLTIVISLLKPFQSDWFTSQLNLAHCCVKFSLYVCLMFLDIKNWNRPLRFNDMWGRKKLLFVIWFSFGGSHDLLFAVSRLIAGIALGVATCTIGAFVGISDPRAATLMIDFINIWPAFLRGFWLFGLEMFGNRPMILWGLAGTLVMAIAMTLAFLVNASALSVLPRHCILMTLGRSRRPILFPDSIRASTSSLCVGINWFRNPVVGELYPYFADALKGFSYLSFVVFLALFYCMASSLVPETFGKTSAEF